MEYLDIGIYVFLYKKLYLHIYFIAAFIVAIHFSITIRKLHFDIIYGHDKYKFLLISYNILT